MKRQIPRVAVLAALALTLLALPVAAAAAVPTNDSLAQAVTVAPAALPFANSVDITDATTEPGEPTFDCTSFARTVWYAITPTHDGTLRADVAGSAFFDTALDVYEQTGAGFGGLVSRACASGTSGTTSATFDARAGHAYYLRAGNQFTSGGTVQLTVAEIPPPPNDAFSNAQAIADVPFGATVDVSAAKTEPGEPTPACGLPGGTAWYAFSPSTSRSVSLSVSVPNPFGSGAVVAAYRGTTLGDLTALGCRGLFSQPLTFRAEAGSRYWIQVAGSGSAASSVRIDLVEAQPPVASFFFSPGDPSVFDTVQFFENTFDPAGNGIQSRSWDFGDGTSLPDAQCCSTTHRYTSDGTYHVELSVTTPDGRSASVMRNVVVATHDVAIAKVSVPASARAGQTKTIAIGIVNTRYPENVTVQLLRSTNGGWEEVARSTQYVAPRRAHKTTDFQFNYTFSRPTRRSGRSTSRRWRSSPALATRFRPTTRSSHCPSR